MLLALTAAAVPAQESKAPDNAAAVARFHQEIQPILSRYCFRCHGEKKQKGGVRLDRLDPDMIKGGDAEGWRSALDMINGGEMPPRRSRKPDDTERRKLVHWLTENIERAAAARQPAEAVIRRLTRSQYTNTLQDLLGLSIEFGAVLPPDGKSKLGFRNNGAVQQSTSLHLDYYQQVAREALQQAIVSGPRPAPTRYLITFGKGIGKGLVAGRTGGYQSVPLSTDDFTVELLDAAGKPRAAASAGEKKTLDGIRRRISIGLRGSAQDRWRLVDDGMILFSAFPRKERAPMSWQGPSPNVKMEMQRVFPERGDFVLRVQASRGEIPLTGEQMLLAAEDDCSPYASLDPAGAVIVPEGAIHLRARSSDKRRNVSLDDGFLVAQKVPQNANSRLRIDIGKDGFYQFDLVHRAGSPDAMPSIRWSAVRRHIDLRPVPDEGIDPATPVVTPIGIAVLRAGRHHFNLGGKFFAGYRDVVVTRLDEEHPVVRRLSQKAEARNAAVAHLIPELRAFVGTRTDDGMDYKTFGATHAVQAPKGAPATYTFRGRLENLPIPEPESGDTEVLSGFMVLGLWNHHLVKQRGETGPPVLIRSLEFEAPYYEQWPPASHQRIFGVADAEASEAQRARQILTRFMGRAFRRPATEQELTRYLAFWRDGREDFHSFADSVRETLVAVLCSPSFLFLADAGAKPQAAEPAADPGGQYALASRLSYFLWDSPPDSELLQLAGKNQLEDQLLDQVDRMLDDPRTERFVRAFAWDWLRLDRHRQMTINVNVHPDFTRFVKEDMEQETYRFVHHVIARDRSVLEFIDSDYAMLNQNLAEFYGIDGVRGSHFRPVQLPAGTLRGGLLNQGAFLAGHSDGTRPHAIKRAVWLKERLLGDPPPPPPPNVPELDPEKPGFEKLTLKQQMEQHRNNPSCRDCHLGIDPYGLPFQQMSAVGRFELKRRGVVVDASSEFPDGTPVDGVRQLLDYLLEVKRDQFVAALIEHLYAYALGRDLQFADEREIRQIARHVELGGYRMRTVLRAIVSSPSFLQNHTRKKNR